MAESDKPERHYKVGRGKPPAQTQFKKGQSGNAKGRPKGSKNFATTIQSELKRRVSVNEDGKRKRITKREAVAKQLVNKAAAGDPRAIPILLKEAVAYESETLDGALGSESLPMSAEDNFVLDNIIKRIRATAGHTELVNTFNEPSPASSDSPKDEAPASDEAKTEIDDAADAS